MHNRHFFYLIVTPIAQALLLLRAAPTPGGLAPSTPFAIFALLFPLACYVWGLRDAPLAPRHSHAALRFLLLGLAALGLTLAGFVYGLTIIAADTVAH